MRARLPDESGYVVNSGVRIHYEVHGTGQPTILLLPTWAIVDSRHWKMQVPFLARHYRVITFDPRGNGRSDRPRDASAYADTAFASDIRAVLDATGTERAVLAGFCTGFIWALLFATTEPQRVTGIVAIAPTLPIPPADPWERYEGSFDDVLDTDRGMGEGEQALLAAGLAGIRRVLHVADRHRAALHQALRRSRGVGHANRRRHHAVRCGCPASDRG